MTNLQNIKLDKQKRILIVMFFVLIVYVDAAYILKAQRSGLNSLNQKITRLNTDLVSLSRELENMRLSKSKPALEAQKKSIMPLKILSENQISGLLQEISTTANKFDIKITQIRPDRQVPKEKPAVGQDKFTPLLINLELVSDYHSLGRFIQALEHSPVFMGIQELEISTQLPDYMKQKVKLVLKTYVTK